MSALPKSICVIDSHTGGEPTRVIVGNGPDLGSGDLRDRVEIFRSHFDAIRSAVIQEPRGSDVVVGALPVPPNRESCSAGVIFFNNVGYLGMCGHGTIGLMVTLHHLGQLGLGEHRLDTPVGEVRATIHDAHTVSFENVPSYRFRKNVQIDVEPYGKVVGDIAWGGNWFFLAEQEYVPVVTAERERLIHLTRAIRRALECEGITGEKGGLIDHIEVFGPGDDLGCDSRNFVLCPGGAYDRSPCGTGTSAKVACLAADGKLKPGGLWRQASIIGSVFEASYRNSEHSGQIIPTIRGTAYLCGESTLLFDDLDPFVSGIPS